MGQTMMIILIAAVLAYLLMSTSRGLLRSSSEEELSYTEFYQMVEEGEVESVEIGTDNRIIIHPSDEAEDKKDGENLENDAPGLAFLVDHAVVAEDGEGEVEEEQDGHHDFIIDGEIHHGGLDRAEVLDGEEAVIGNADVPCDIFD